jgi:hypothetical protein
MTLTILVGDVLDVPADVLIATANARLHTITSLLPHGRRGRLRADRESRPDPFPHLRENRP